MGMLFFLHTNSLLPTFHTPLSSLSPDSFLPYRGKLFHQPVFTNHTTT